MTTPNGNGNGGHSLRQIADNVVVVAAARAAQIVGVPLAGWLFLQMWGGIADIGKIITDIRLDVRDIKGEQGRLKQVDEDMRDRITRIERAYERSRTRGIEPQ